MNKEELLLKLQRLHFMVIDIGLYLDTHPKDKDALKCYEKYSKLSEAAKEKYEENFGPLSIFGVDIDDNWSWNESPWPWEEDCYVDVR